MSEDMGVYSADSVYYDEDERFLDDMFPDLADDDEIGDDFDTTFAKVIRGIINRKSTIDGLASKIRELSARKSAFEKRTERAKEYLMSMLRQTGLTKWVSGDMDLTCRLGYSTSFDGDVDILSDEFVRIKKEVDKTAISLYYKNGKGLPPGASKTEKEHVVVK